MALRDSIPASAKAKIADVTTMDEAWRLLDLEFGDVQELRAKLKDQVRGIKIKATKDSARIVELFHQIQIIAVKIKATGNLDMLENDDEYIALVSKHLPKDVMWRWWESDKSGWSNFYLFLEGIAKIAKKQQTSESIMSALSGEGEKSKCSSCHKIHSGKCNKKNTALVSQNSDKKCPVCDKDAHLYKTKNGQEAISKRVKDCPGFKEANDDQKKEMVKKLKNKYPLCAKCSSWYHKSQDCTWKANCTKCGDNHLNDLCSLKKFFTCSLSTKGSCMMSLQDVPIKNSSIKARTMFDNGSKLTLVSSFFANKNNFSYEEATYTISRVGGAESTF